MTFTLSYIPLGKDAVTETFDDLDPALDRAIDVHTGVMLEVGSYVEIRDDDGDTYFSADIA